MSEEKKEDKILITSAEADTEIFRIEDDGRVFWRPEGGKLVEAKVDADLALAFSAAIEAMAEAQGNLQEPAHEQPKHK